MVSIEHLQYPIGRYEQPDSISFEQYQELVKSIRNYPKKLREALDNAKSANDYQKTYRDGSWNVQQLVHHIADAQMNYYIRSKLAYTEKDIRFSYFDENLWAVLDDTLLPPDVSLQIIAGVNMRWSTFLQSVNADQINQAVISPDGEQLSIAVIADKVVWHCEHHLAHIQLALTL